MARRSWSVLGALGALLSVGACRDSTGLHVFAHLGALDYDALELEVVRPADAAGASPRVLVDPASSGRYPGPFRGGDQDVYVYLPDDLDGAQLQCTMTALRSAAAVAQGTAEARVHRHDVVDVHIVMTGLDSAGAAGGAGGSAAVGGTGGSPMPPGTGGGAGESAMPPGTAGGAGGSAMAPGTGGGAGGSPMPPGSGVGGSPMPPGAGGSAAPPGSGAGGSAMPPATGAGGSPMPPATGGAPGTRPAGNGTACNTAAECASNHCVDGVCCESACSGACTSCATAGAAGLCRPAPAGAPDPRGVCLDMGAATCGTNGLCDVSGHCAKYPAGTTCAAASCKNGEMLKAAATCDGAGACKDGATMKCAGHCAGDACS